MAKRRESQSTQDEQSKLFIEKAREIGCDDGGGEDEIMRRLAGLTRPERSIGKNRVKKQITQKKDQ